jgi:hypothetical protein
MSTILKLPISSIRSMEGNFLPIRHYKNLATPRPDQCIKSRPIGWKDIWVMI